MGSSQFVLNQLGLKPLSPDLFYPFSTGPCFIGPLEFCPMSVRPVSFRTRATLSSTHLVLIHLGLDQIVPLSVRPLDISCFFFSYSVIFVLFQIDLCYFVLNPNRPLPLRP